MSKGSRPRPFTVNQNEFGDKFESIFGKKPPRAPYVPPPLPAMEPEVSSEEKLKKMFQQDETDK